MEDRLLGFIYLGTLVWFIVTCVFVRISTTEGEPTTKQVWEDIMWPIHCIKFLFWLAIGFTNESLYWILLTIGIKYKNTRMYHRVKEWCNKILW